MTTLELTRDMEIAGEILDSSSHANELVQLIRAVRSGRNVDKLSEEFIKSLISHIEIKDESLRERDGDLDIPGIERNGFVKEYA